MRGAAEEPDFSRVDGLRTSYDRLRCKRRFGDGLAGHFARSGGAL